MPSSTSSNVSCRVERSDPKVTSNVRTVYFKWQQLNADLPVMAALRHIRRSRTPRATQWAHSECCHQTPVLRFHHLPHRRLVTPYSLLDSAGKRRSLRWDHRHRSRSRIGGWWVDRRCLVVRSMMRRMLVSSRKTEVVLVD